MIIAAGHNFHKKFSPPNAPHISSPEIIARQ